MGLGKLDQDKLPALFKCRKSHGELDHRSRFVRNFPEILGPDFWHTALLWVLSAAPAPNFRARHEEGRLIDLGSRLYCGNRAGGAVKHRVHYSGRRSLMGKRLFAAVN